MNEDDIEYFRVCQKLVQAETQIEEQKRTIVRYQKENELLRAEIRVTKSGKALLR